MDTHYLTCRLCGETLEEEPHDFTTEGAQEATCTEDGYTGDQVCSACYWAILGTAIPTIDHNFVDGVCTECGAEDPDYVNPGGIENPSTGEEPGDEDPNAGKDPGTDDGNKQPATDEPGDGDLDDPKANANDQTTEPGAKAVQAGDAGVPLTAVALLLGALVLAIASFALRRIRS